MDWRKRGIWMGFYKGVLKWAPTKPHPYYIKLPSLLYIHLQNQYVFMWKKCFRISTKKTLTLHKFCIQYPNVALWCVGTSFHLTTKKYENLTSLLIEIVHNSRNCWFGGDHFYVLLWILCILLGSNFLWWSKSIIC